MKNKLDCTNGTLYAKWTRNSITLATPTRAGYVFKGWFTATSGGTQITSSTVIDKNQTIYAQWDKIIPIEIGDYINYTPDTTAQKVYSKNNLVENLTGSTNNSADITQDNLNWQVLRKYDDGSMDIIGSPTTQYIYFSDATGYNNGVYIMHDICEKLYSRTGIKARSVTLEDMDYWMTNTGKTTKNNYIKNKVSEALSDDYVVNEIYAGDLANNAVTYIKDYSYYPNLYASENGSGINTRTVKTNGITDTNKSTLDRTIRPNSYKQANNLTVTQTSYNMGITNINYGDGSKVLNNSNRYWIASRSVEIVTEEMYWGMNTSMAGFSLRSANTQMGGTAMFDSNCVKYSGGSYLRPVIHLGANVKITRSETASNAGTPHRITQY